MFISLFSITRIIKIGLFGRIHSFQRHWHPRAAPFSDSFFSLHQCKIPHLQTKHNQSYHYKPKQMESMSSPTFYINKDGVGRYADDNADDEHSATAIVTKTATQTPNPPKAASDEDTVKES
jgi:hypothetical protein